MADSPNGCRYTRHEFYTKSTYFRPRISGSPANGAETKRMGRDDDLTSDSKKACQLAMDVSIDCQSEIYNGDSGIACSWSRKLESHCHGPRWIFIRMTTYISGLMQMLLDNFKLNFKLK